MISTASPPASADTHGLVVLREVVRELLVGRLLDQDHGDDVSLPHVDDRIILHGLDGGEASTILPRLTNQVLLHQKIF